MFVPAFCLASLVASGLALVDSHAPPQAVGPELEVLDGDAASVDAAMARTDWHRSTTVEVTRGLQRAVMWVRFDVETQSDDAWLLWARFPRPQQIEHWTFVDGVVVDHDVTGLNVARDVRPVDDVELLLPLVRHRGHVVHVLRADARPARLQLLAGSQASIAAARANDGVIAGLYYGIFIALVAFNLAFGVATRDPAHLLYCVFVVCMALHMAVRDGWLPPELPEAIFGRGAGMTLTALAMLAFTRRFLDVDASLPRFVVLYRAALGVTAVAALLPFVGFDMARVGGVLTLANCGVVVVSAGVLAVRGDRPARLFLLAWSVMITATISAVVHALGIIDIPWAATSGVRIGAAAEMILLSIALAARVDVLRRAKDDAERALSAARETRQREILQQVLAANEAERERFARDLHDGLGHTLLLLRQRSASEAPSLCDPLGAALDDVRRVARDLSPPVLDRLGLISAVRGLCESHERATGVDVEFAGDASDEDAEMLGDRAIHAYRIVQEALSNATRHGAPQHIEVTAARRGAALHLRVVDDGGGVDGGIGVGFVAGTGLTGMEQRVRLLGGSFSFSSTERGCVVDASFPLAGASDVIVQPGVS